MDQRQFINLDLKEYEFIIGMTIPEAKKALNGMDEDNPLNIQFIYLRAIKIDGIPQVVTMDLRMNRLNVCTKNGKISEIRKIG